MITLNATLRSSENLSKIRENGDIPAIVYGGKLTESISVSVNREDFKRTWRTAGGSTALGLVIDGKKHDVLIHDLQIDPRTDVVIHADFLAIDANTEVTVGVELEFTGVSAAVKAGLGHLEKMLHEISVEALPKDLPHNLVVDISSLENVGDQIHVGDLTIPAGVRVVGHDASDIVVVISGHKEEEESTGTIDFDSIEVAKKGKKEVAE
jgi:large subunit ribosomal protein L25